MALDKIKIYKFKQPEYNKTDTSMLMYSEARVQHRERLSRITVNIAKIFSTTFLLFRDFRVQKDLVRRHIVDVVVFLSQLLQ